MTLYIAAATREAAVKRASAIYAGVLPTLPIYETREAAEAWAASMNAIHTDKRTVFEISIPAEQQERDAA